MQQPIARHRYHVRRRFGRAQDADITDPYRKAKKPSGPALCPECGAVFQDGRWHWRDAPGQAESATCPACVRIRDNYPAGELRLSGSFVVEHRAELMAVAQHNEAEEKIDHPLNRIINIVDDGDAIVVTTTDIHLPRRIGQAMRRAYHGKLDIHYDPGADFIRVNWARD